MRNSERFMDKSILPGGPARGDARVCVLHSRFQVVINTTLNAISTYWENGNSSCYIDFQLSNPCEQGLVPTIVLDAHSVAHVQQGVNFARTHRLRLRIKASGHDSIGRASGEGAFLIWTRNLRSLALVPDFKAAGTPIGISSVRVIKSGPGDGWQSVYKLANRSDVTVIGGTGQTVSSAGGYLMGGGVSPPVYR
jgi:hypothetical protein